MKGWDQVPLDQWQVALGFSASFLGCTTYLYSPQLPEDFYGPSRTTRKEAKLQGGGLLGKVAKER